MRALKGSYFVSDHVSATILNGFERHLNESTLNTCFSDIYHKRVYFDRLCGLVVRVRGYRSRGSDSIPGATRFSEK
jgi:hypothetical protein